MAMRPMSSVLGLIAGLCGLVASPSADAAGISLQMDEAQILTFKSPVKTILIGNPLIADVTVIDPRHAVVLGKSFGITNFIALNAEGNQTFSDQVTVFARESGVVTLHRGTGKTTLTCNADHCEATPVPGDETASFDALSGQVEKHETASLKAAGQ